MTHLLPYSKLLLCLYSEALPHFLFKIPTHPIILCTLFSLLLIFSIACHTVLDCIINFFYPVAQIILFSKHSCTATYFSDPLKLGKTSLVTLPLFIWIVLLVKVTHDTFRLKHNKKSRIFCINHVFQEESTFSGRFKCWIKVSINQNDLWNSAPLKHMTDT
jgi:hypothetical protein